MEIQRKKILFVPLAGIIERGESGLHVRKDVMRRMRSLKNIVRVAVVTDGNDSGDFFKAFLKAVEFFVFCYCKTAVSTHYKTDDTSVIDDVMKTLPHGLRKRELMVMVGDKESAERFGIDFIEMEDFVCTG